MLIDCHVHISAVQPGHGAMSPKLLRSIPFKFLKYKFCIDIASPSADDQLKKLLFDQLAGAQRLDAAVVLAFDAVYDKDGRRDDANTHLFIENDYVIQLAKENPKVLFGASVHPYRRDAIAELERCIAAGAVLLKWLPITQGIDPTDHRCHAFYECLAHHGLPLLSHTGGEKMLPNINRCADPTLLLPALRRGATVIAAHCGTRSRFYEHNYLPAFMRMALEHEKFYGDTAALNLPGRSYAYRKLLNDERVRAKLIHGSDWPVMPLPPFTQLGSRWLHLMDEANWLTRDIEAKRELGFDDAYWARAASILKMS